MLLQNLIDDTPLKLTHHLLSHFWWHFSHIVIRGRKEKKAPKIIYQEKLMDKLWIIFSDNLYHIVHVQFTLNFKIVWLFSNTELNAHTHVFSMFGPAPVSCHPTHVILIKWVCALVSVWQAQAWGFRDWRGVRKQPQLLSLSVLPVLPGTKPGIPAVCEAQSWTLPWCSPHQVRKRFCWKHERIWGQHIWCCRLHIYHVFSSSPREGAQWDQTCVEAGMFLENIIRKKWQLWG